MKRLAAILVVLTLACTQARVISNEAPKGVVQGIVTDNTGAVLPGVTVWLSTTPPRSTVTDAQGTFQFIGVPYGRYEVRGELAGANASTYRIAVASERGASLRMTLLMGAVSEAITVTAEAPVPWSTKSVLSTASVPSTRTSYQYDFMQEVAPQPSYGHFNDHAFIDTKNERTTTFAIDVDRASYANVRRMITSGLRVPPDAVRIEELVNYFPWSYPQPDGDAPFSVTSEVAGCPWKPEHRLLRVGIQGRALEQWKMAPNNLVFLIDVSGSMGPPNRLPLLRTAFRVLVDELRAEDKVSIVVYAGAPGLVLPPTSGADKAAILAALDNLEAGGSTAGGAGIELAYNVAQQNFIQDGNNRVILATDGDFNVGVSGPQALEKLIEQKRKSDIFLSVLGVGDDNYQEDAMETLADKGNGNFFYLDSLAEAEKVFRQELTGTLVTIAKDVKVQLEFDPAKVASYRQIGYENRALANKDFDDDEKDAGELGAGHSVTALFEIVPASSDVRGEIATLRLRYKEPRGAKSVPLTATIVDEGKSAYEASPDMQFAAAIAQFGMLLRNSPHKGTASWDDVLSLAKVATGADLDGTRREFVAIAERARRMR
ncbi:MAG TPA: von Willebrand factor type A domain-containing protein [Thermoanaerobaculia bacterium]|nr:von Willebrand factor type A domain-containing protein [Thermoanaerobaculia bacterium]